MLSLPETVQTNTDSHTNKGRESENTIAAQNNSLDGKHTIHI